MEYLIISDVHLDNKTKPNKLKYYIDLVSAYENIILNGDFYESRYFSADKFLNGVNKPLLDILKTKNVTYIYGNHDPKLHAKKTAEAISKVQTKYIKLEIGDRKYHIEHGDRLSMNDVEEAPIWMFRLMDGIGRTLQVIYPPLVTKIGSKWNQLIITKRYNDGLISPEELLICGHTHVDVDMPDIHYINSGSSMFNKGKYIVLDERGYHINSFDLSQIS